MPIAALQPMEKAPDFLDKGTQRITGEPHPAGLIELFHDPSLSQERAHTPSGVAFLTTTGIAACRAEV
jgi:hypothetical protein